MADRKEGQSHSALEQAISGQFQGKEFSQTLSPDLIQLVAGRVNQEGQRITTNVPRYIAANGERARGLVQADLGGDITKENFAALAFAMGSEAILLMAGRTPWHSDEEVPEDVDTRSPQGRRTDDSESRDNDNEG
jgi:hypothetical protein